MAYTCVYTRNIELVSFCGSVSRYFRNLVSFGTIQQSQMLFGNLMSGMMDIGKELDSFASLGAQSVRVQDLL